MIKKTIFVIALVIGILFVDINFIGTKVKKYDFVLNNDTFSLQYPFLYDYLDF